MLTEHGPDVTKEVLTLLWQTWAEYGVTYWGHMSDLNSGPHMFGWSNATHVANIIGPHVVCSWYKCHLIAFGKHVSQTWPRCGTGGIGFSVSTRMWARFGAE